MSLWSKLQNSWLSWTKENFHLKWEYICFWILSSACSVGPWSTVFTGAWREARLLSRSSAPLPCPGNSTPPCWWPPGTAAPTPQRPRRGGRGVGGIEAEGEGGGGGEGEGGGEPRWRRRRRVWRTSATGLLSWWAMTGESSSSRKTAARRQGHSSFGASP